MNAEIRDEQVLRTLVPTNIVRYLKSRHWEMVGRVREDVPVFSKGDQEVYLPLSQDYADFALRMAELLRALALDEERSQLVIFEELVFSAADRIRFRLRSPLATRGSLPINLGVRFFERARDLIFAAACAAVEVKPFYQGRRYQRVEEYMAKVYLGQTERGSFVINAGSPITPPVEQLVDEEPFERTVTHRLLTSVMAAKVAAQEASMQTAEEPFYNAHTQGVSANLCGALSDLFLDEDSGRLEIGLQWSPLRPAPNVETSVVSLDASLAPIFAEASRSLRQRASREDFTAEGWITKLHREQDQEQGNAVIYAPVDGCLRQIKVQLEGEDYTRAIQAHADRLPVALDGELIRSGKSYILKHPRKLRITEAPDDNDELTLGLG
jgi:hypothetical protein